MTNPENRLWFVFNELSARSKAESRDSGRKRMNDMANAIARAMSGKSAELVSVGSTSFWETELAAGYTVTNWWTSADPDLKQLLMGIATKTDFPEEMGNALRDRFRLSEFRLPEQPEASASAEEARGLGAAYLLCGVGVSLPTEPQWKSIRVTLRHRWLDWLDEDGRIRENTVEVANFSEPNQADRISRIVLQRQQTLVDNLQGLAVRKEECFPHLSFGREVDRHFDDLPRTILSLLIQKLAIMDDACWKWRRNNAMLRPQLSNCRPESKPTMQKYGHLRVFPDPRGRDRTYELHVSVGRAHRIHLRILHRSRGIEIGYVGKHLPTQSFN